MKKTFTYPQMTIRGFHVEKIRTTASIPGRNVVDAQYDMRAFGKYIETASYELLKFNE